MSCKQIQVFNSKWHNRKTVWWQTSEIKTEKHRSTAVLRYPSLRCLLSCISIPSSKTNARKRTCVKEQNVALECEKPWSFYSPPTQKTPNNRLFANAVISRKFTAHHHRFHQNGESIHSYHFCFPKSGIPALSVVPYASAELCTSFLVIESSKARFKYMSVVVKNPRENATQIRIFLYKPVGSIKLPISSMG